MTILLVIVGALLASILIWATISLCTAPVILEGKVIEKHISKEPDEDSLIKIETTDGVRILLKFETREMDSYVVVCNDVFYGKAEELDKAIDVGDYIRVDTYDRSGLTRKVSKLLSVMSTKK
jgi:hypothetical protein